MNWLATFRLGLAIVFFCLGLLTVIHIPHLILWMPSVIASEWGHLIAVLPALLLFGRWRLFRSKLAFAFAFSAIVLLLSPLVRVLWDLQQLPATIEETFGRLSPPGISDVPSRSEPIVFSDLFRFNGIEVVPESRIFKAGLELDLYRRKDLNNHLPLVIIIHGGYWQTGDSRQIPAVNHYLARRGYAVAAINYRKAPANPFPAARDDVIAAVDYLKHHAEEFSVDSKRIVLLGRSAGAQLALVTAYTMNDSGVRGVVSLYGPTDMVWSWNHPGNPLVIDARRYLREYLNGTPHDTLERYRQASPLNLIHANSPPTLMLHGQRDELIWARQSERLSEKLTELGVKNLLIKLAWGDHGFDCNLWGPSGQIYLYVLERFIAAVVYR